MNKIILLVDDDESIIRLLAVRLIRKNFDVLIAHDGLECLEIAQIELPDLILMDIKMPNLGGIEAFEKLILNDKTKNIPVLFMTAFPRDEILNQVLKMGAKGCISKPFIPADFEQTIQNVFA